MTTAPDATGAKARDGRREPAVQREHEWYRIAIDELRSTLPWDQFAAERGLLKSTVAEAARALRNAQDLAGDNVVAARTLASATPSAIRKICEAVRAKPALADQVAEILRREDGASAAKAIEKALEATRGHAPGQIRSPRPRGQYGKAVALEAARRAMGPDWRAVTGPRDKAYGIAGTIADATGRTIAVMTLVNPEVRARHGKRDEAKRAATATAIRKAGCTSLIVVVPRDWPLADELEDDVAEGCRAAGRDVRFVRSGQMKRSITPR